MPRATRISVTLACAYVCAMVCAMLAAGSAGAAPWNPHASLGIARQPGQLLHARGMTIDSSGFVYVADTGHDRVQKFDSNGTYIGELGVPGSGAGQLSSPSDVAVDASGDILVVDSGNHRIQRFDATGAFISQFGGWGTGDGQFNDPWGIAIAPGGELYVTDQWNQRVQYFNAAGTYLGKFGTFGTANGQLNDPRGIAVAADGTVLVADNFNDRMQRFTAAGVFIDKATTHSGSTPLAAISDVALDASGNVYLSDSWHGAVQKYDSTLTWTASFGIYGFINSDDGIDESRSVAVDATGNVYALDSSFDRVVKFAPAGTVLTRFGTQGAGEFAHPEGITRSPVSGNLYVADTTNDRVQVWSSAGAYVGAFGSTGTGDGQFRGPTDVAVGTDGSVYVTDVRNCRVQRFTAAGAFQSKFGGPCGAPNGRMIAPTGITTAKDGSLLIVNAGNFRVDRFTAAGAFVSSFGSFGSGSGQFNQPWAVDEAPDGTIYVTDQSNHRVQHFTAAGAFINAFGTQGNGPGQVDRPRGISVSSDGSVFVVDWGNRRVNRYSASGTFLESQAASGVATDLVSIAPNAIWVTESGDDRVELYRSEPDAPATLQQLQNDGLTSVSAGAWTDQTSAVLAFDVSAAVGSQTLTPWVEIRPIGTPLSAICGATVAGVTFTAPAVRTDAMSVGVRTSVRVSGLVSGTEYHWRSCSVDQDGAVSAWTSMGGSDGTRDLGVDTSGPFTVRGTARRTETDATAWQACDSISPNVRISVAGAASVATSCDRMTGAFAFTGLVKPASGQLLTVWMDEPTSNGVTYYSVGADASSIALRLVQNRATLDTELAADTITRAELQVQDAVDEPAIALDATTGGEVSLPSSGELHIAAGVTFASQGQLNVGSFHVSGGAQLTTGSAVVRVTGSGVEDDCTLGPRRSTPMCVEAGGEVAPIQPWTPWFYASSDPSSSTAVSTDIDYASLYVGEFGRYELGTRPGQTLNVASQFGLDPRARLRSDRYAPDVDAYSVWVGYEAIWRSTRSFTIDVLEGFAGDGKFDAPAADVTTQGRSPINYLGSNQFDWDVGSLSIGGSNSDHEFGFGGIDVHDGGGVDEPVAQATGPNDEHVFVVYNRANGGTGQDWVIRKYYSYGSGLDPTFGVGGELALASPGPDRAASIAIGAGVLYVGGTMNGGWAVRAIDSVTGAPVTAFDGDGTWQPAIGGSITAVAAHKGSLFVAGTDAVPAWRILRLDQSATVIESLDWDGDTGSGPTDASISAICAGPEWESGEITIVGNVGAAGNRDWALGRIRPTAGVWDWEPMLSGSAQPEPVVSVGTDDAATSCYVTPGLVYIGGVTGNGGASNVGTIRTYMRETGDPWIYFGTGGVQTIDGPGEDTLADISGVSSRDSLLVLSGDATNGGRSVVRALDPDGTTDPTFANGAGELVYDDTGGDEHPVSLNVVWLLTSVLTSSGSGSGDVAVQQINPNGERQNAWGPGASRTVVLGSGKRLDVHGDLTIGTGSASYRTVLDAKVFNGDIHVDGSVRTRTDATLRAPRWMPLELGGDLEIAGPFSNSLGVIRGRPGARRMQVEVLPATDFYVLDVESTRAGGEVRFDSADPIHVTGAFRAVGRSCAEPLRLRGIGSGWTLDASAIAEMSHLDISDVTANPAVAATDSWDSGNNVNTFFVSPCASASAPAAPDQLRTNGSEHPEDVVDQPAPVFEWTNRTGSDVDTADVEVLSSSDQGLLGLYHFDAGSETADSSGNGNLVAGDTTSSGTGRFGAGRSSTGAQNVTLPSMPISQNFTASLWFKRGALQPSDAPFPVLLDRCISVCSVKNIDVHLDRDNHVLLGEVTSGNGATTHRTSVPVDQYLDDEWHHVALAHTGGQLRLYVDGEQVDNENTAPTGIDTGAWTSSAGWNLEGDIDDVAIYDRGLSSAEIRGYFRTQRPNLSVVWSGSGLPLATSADGAQAAITYAGSTAALARDGARFWTRSRFRTTSATWSTWSPLDWFETTLADRTTVELPDGGTQPLGHMLAGTDTRREFRVRVTSTSESGWSMFARGESDSHAFSNGLGGAANEIARRTTSLWPAGAGGFAGLTVVDADGGKDTSTWGTGTDPAVYADLRYMWPAASTSMLLHDFPTLNLAPQDVTVGVRVNPGTGTRASQFTGTLDVTVVPNP